jgi:uncharacterized protein
MIPVTLGSGDLGDVVMLSEQARLKQFIRDEDSETLKLFHPNQKDRCMTGDWYGEHAGKWLVAAGLTYRSNPSEEWRERIARVVAFLADQQEESGYLGTYGAESSARFTHDDAEGVRTWDLWIHAWLLLGFLEVEGISGCERATESAQQIGELILCNFNEGRSPVNQGNHAGLSSLVLLEPLALMASRWNDSRYSDFAERLFDQAVESGLNFWAEIDASNVGTGKSYQLLWVMKGILELSIVTGRSDLQRVVEWLWRNIRDYHLTPHGGPWGGIATHKEVFNPAEFFDPCGLVETCSSVTWMILSQKLFEVTKITDYLVEVEKTLYNSVLGAIDANGLDWCYFIFPNGRRNNTYHWACCKSSGALGLAFASRCFATELDGVCCLTGLDTFSFVSPNGVRVIVESTDGVSTIQVERPLALRVFISPTIELAVVPEGASWDGKWLEFEELSGSVEIRYREKFSVETKVHSVDHHGQEIVREEYVCAKVGRFVYAAGKFDGYRTQETLRLPQLAPASVFEVVGDGELELRQAGRDVIKMVPYWKCGGRHDGAWRTTWLQVAWQ